MKMKLIDKSPYVLFVGFNCYKLCSNDDYDSEICSSCVLYDDVIFGETFSRIYKGLKNETL